jgi:hypothetical protein
MRFPGVLPPQSAPLAESTSWALCAERAAAASTRAMSRRTLVTLCHVLYNMCPVCIRIACNVYRSYIYKGRPSSSDGSVGSLVYRSSNGSLLGGTVAGGMSMSWRVYQGSSKQQDATCVRDGPAVQRSRRERAPGAQ